MDKDIEVALVIGYQQTAAAAGEGGITVDLQTDPQDLQQPQRPFLRLFRQEMFPVSRTAHPPTCDDRHLQQKKQDRRNPQKTPESTDDAVVHRAFPPALFRFSSRRYSAR